MVEHETVLIVGSGAREQAIAHSLLQDTHVKEVLIAPGNAGTECLPRGSDQVVSNVELSNSDVSEIVDIAKARNVSTVVVGPEEWLNRELGDVLEMEGISAIAPKKEVAMLELDKTYAREMCAYWGVPQPEYTYFSETSDALAYVSALNLTEGVVKVAGPALGKGVTVCSSSQELCDAISSAKENFGSAADKILIEEKLVGREISYIVLTDGISFLPLTPALDYKLLNGKNTGGMGAIAPNPHITLEKVEQIEKQIIKPIINGMKSKDTPYVGVLYAGIMLTKEGPKLIEINTRFGDPETQSQLPLLKTRFYSLCKSVTEGTLSNEKPIRTKDTAVTVVLASKNYPSFSRKGDLIFGLDERLRDGVTLYHAGTKKRHGEIVTNGGRVLSVTSVSKTINSARENAYAAIGDDGINFSGMQYRSDIGLITNNK